MKKALFILLWLSCSLLLYAQTEDGPKVLSSQNDSTLISIPSIPDMPAVLTGEFPAYQPLSIQTPALLLSSTSFSSCQAIYTAPHIELGKTDGQDLPRWIILSASAREYPGLMRTETGTLGVSGQNGNFSYNAYAGAIKYATFHTLETSYIIGGEATLHFNPSLSLTVFGAYYTRNPYLGMAAYPYIQTTNFGGYMTISPNTAFSLSLGAKSYYDPFARRMEVDPIITPTLKVGKVKVGVDVGHAAKNYIHSLFRAWSK